MLAWRLGLSRLVQVVHVLVFGEMGPTGSTAVCPARAEVHQAEESGTLRGTNSYLDMVNMENTRLRHTIEQARRSSNTLARALGWAALQRGWLGYIDCRLPASTRARRPLGRPRSRWKPRR